VPGAGLKAAATGLLVTALVGGVAKGEPALVEVENLVLRADGGFQPRTLPKHRFAPTDFEGWASVRSRDGGPPVPLRQIVLDFDRDGRLAPGNLPVCASDQIAEATPTEARQTCAAAQIGTGRIRATLSLASGAVPASSPLSLFNGPRQEGNPTVVVHAQTTVPGLQTYALVAPIERRPGPFRYRATLDLPPIAGGLGAITYIGIEISRRFRSGGKQHSYTTARCSSGVLRTKGRFSFADGTVVNGAVEKGCTAR
jgi:hypothetical protein